VKKPKSQPAITMEDFRKLYKAITNPRDRLILKVLFLGGVRRGELFVIKWKDWDGQHTLKIERSFDAQTHRVKEWSGKVTGPKSAEVAVPPGLAEDLNGWRRYGNTDSSKPDSYIFPTRNGTPILARNWSEDVLKPAGKEAGIPGVSYHWFRRGHATIQHFSQASDKAIQGQLRHSKAETTREVYMQQVSSETLAAVSRLEAAMLAATA
jgi:integrase/recombinase XerD